MRFPLAWNFAYFRQPPPPPPFFFLIKMTPLWNIFALIWKGFFTRSLNLHLHIWQYLFFVSQTLNTALGRKKKKRKKRNPLCFCLELCEIFLWKGSEGLWDFPLLDKVRRMTPAWVWGASDGGRCNWYETQKTLLLSIPHALSRFVWHCPLQSTFRHSCLQDLKSWLSTTLLRRYLSLGWCWKIPVTFRKR